MMISTMAEAEVALERFYGITEKTMGKDITVGRMERLMAHIGHPERELKVIHIAGTSGKTSTSYFTAALLKSAGVSVGLTVSPHIDSVRERIQLNGQPIDERLFCKYLSEFLTLIDDLPEAPTWSECIMALALWIFTQEKLDYVVIETMLGGLHDATNILTRTDKLCVITDIGYDHMQILGDTLQKIAHQKAGIIHIGNHAIMYDQGPEIVDVVKQRVSEQQASLSLYSQITIESSYDGDIAPSLPEYQKRNWLLAREAYVYIAHRDGLPELSAESLHETQSIQVPGRMDMRVVEAREVVMDGAHNHQKMQAFVRSYQARYGDEKVPVLLALKQDKDIGDVAALISSIASEVVVTTFSKIQDLPIVSMDPQAIANTLVQSGLTNVQVIENQDEAYKEFLGLPGERRIISGSFFLISQLRENRPELK